MQKRNLTYVIFATLTLFIAACTTSTNTPTTQPTASPDTNLPTDSSSGSEGLPLWMTAQLKDVNTGDSFSIAQFKGTPVLMESFAVWCPVCTRQQQESKKLEELMGDGVISVSLNTDPNEDESKVKDHIQKNGFDWRYAISPSEVTNSLTDDFGISIVNVPFAPMVVICGDQTTHRLRNGVKSAVELQSSVNDLCA